MQRDHDDRDVRDREREYDHRFPPPPDMSVHRSSSFLRGLPPPISATPRGYYPPSPGMRDAHSPGPGHGEHISWGGGSHASASPSAMEMPRPSSSRRGGGWSPPSKSPRYTDRLPSMSDYPQPPPTHHAHAPRHWEAPLPPHPYIKAEPYHHNSPLRDHESYASPRIPGAHEMTTRPPPTAPYERSIPSPRSSAGTRPQTAPTGRSTSKHPAPSSQESTSEKPRKKKRRQAFSCAECSKRKQKCNRETPCQHCVSRKVPHLCVPTRPTQGSPQPRQKPKTEGQVSSSAASSSRAKAPEAATPLHTGPPCVLTSRVSKLENIVNAVLNRVDGMDGSSLTEWRQCESFC